MPRKRRIAKTRTPRAPRQLVVYFLTGEWDSDDSGVLNDVTVDVEFDISPNRALLFELRAGRQLAEWWTALREPLVDGWIATYPGTRPFGWWVVDAPRWRREDLPERQRFFADANVKLPEPRRRLGGVGDPIFEHLNFAPELSFGVPVQFVHPDDVAYYNGRATKPLVGEPYKDGDFSGQAIDPADPPRYESEAAYLKRHERFVDGECERLPGDAFDLTVVVDEECEDDDAEDVPAA